MALTSQIGLMDHYVEVVKFTTTKGALNENSRTQTSIKNVWAAVNFKSSGEDVEEKVYNINRRDYVIHFDADIASEVIQDLAIIDDGFTYYVTGFNSEIKGRKMFILLNCEYRG